MMTRPVPEHSSRRARALAAVAAGANHSAAARLAGVHRQQVQRWIAQLRRVAAAA